jgi:hypothetical protein
MDWIHLAQNRDQWRALVNTVMNLPFRDFLSGISCMQLVRYRPLLFWGAGDRRFEMISEVRARDDTDRDVASGKYRQVS